MTIETHPIEARLKRLEDACERLSQLLRMTVPVPAGCIAPEGTPMSPDFRVAVQLVANDSVHFIIHPSGHSGDTLDLVACPFGLALLAPFREGESQSERVERTANSLRAPRHPPQRRGRPSMSDEMKACANTDRELWRETEGDYYSPSIHVTEGGGIGIDVGGTVIVKPLREWHRAAIEAATVKGDGLVGWQPIETAPKDGTWILVWLSTDVADTVTWAFGGWWDGALGHVKEEHVQLTHWTPLPAPPGEDTPEAADTITTLKGEIERLREAVEPILRFHETGGHEGDGSDAALARARQALGSTDNVG